MRGGDEEGGECDGRLTETMPCSCWHHRFTYTALGGQSTCTQHWVVHSTGGQSTFTE